MDFFYSREWASATLAYSRFALHKYVEVMPGDRTNSTPNCCTANIGNCSRTFGLGCNTAYPAMAIEKATGR